MENPHAADGFGKLIEIKKPLPEHGALGVERSHVANYVADGRVDANVTHPVHPPGHE